MAEQPGFWDPLDGQTPPDGKVSIDAATYKWFRDAHYELGTVAESVLVSLPGPARQRLMDAIKKAKRGPQ